MSRASLRWLVGLCSTSVVLILLWTNFVERATWEPAQFRVARDSFVAGNVRIGSDGNNSVAVTSWDGYNSLGDGRIDYQFPFVDLNSSRPDLPPNQHGEGQGRRPEEVETKYRSRARVLLVSYMRSGSTFTGDIFQSVPGVFYLYEPLLYVNDDDYMSQEKRLVRSRLIPKAMGIPNPPETQNYTLDTLNCKLSDQNLRFLYGLTYSRSTMEFNECQKKLGVKPSAFGECGERLRARCEQSEAVVSKILRLKMWEVEKLLAEDPELRVIHLVRDPRGVYISRRAVGYYFRDGPFCARFNADSRMSAQLQVKYPGRILTTRYEDLATNAAQVAKILFDFAGIRWSKEVEDSLNNMTSNTDVRVTENVFNTRRKNSSLTASSWRNKIEFHKAIELQNLCKSAMELYGYVSFHNHHDLHDLNLASFRTQYSDQFHKAQVFR